MIFCITSFQRPGAVFSFGQTPPVRFTVDLLWIVMATTNQNNWSRSFSDFEPMKRLFLAFCQFLQLTMLSTISLPLFVLVDSIWITVVTE